MKPVSVKSQTDIILWILPLTEETRAESKKSLTFLRSPLLFLFAHGAVMRGLLVTGFWVKQPQAHSDVRAETQEKVKQLL